MPDTELLRTLAASLAIGILIGIERGWRQRDANDGSRVSGLRTFGLLGLTGGLAGHVPDLLAAAIALAALSSLVLGYRSALAREGSLSVTNTLVGIRSEEHTSELQSLMRNSYDVFCLKKNTNHKHSTLQRD